VYRLNLHSFYLIIIQQTLRPSPHMQPQVHRTNIHQYAPTPVPRRCHCYVRHSYSSFSLTQKYMYGFKCTGSKQTAVAVTGLSITEGIQNVTCFSHSNLAPSNVVVEPMFFGKSAYPVLACITHNGAHLHHTSSHWNALGFCANKAFLCRNLIQQNLNSGNAQHSSRLDVVSFTNGYRRFDRQ